MSRTRCCRAARILALVYVAAMAAGGFAAGSHGPSPVDPLLSGLSQPGLNILYVFVLMPLVALFGDSGEGAGEAVGTALACGLGAAVNVLLLRTVVCFARAVGAELPACRKRRTPLR
ncbi:hypothetical protein B046DRAFT_03927 [Streptomyces sp. LamerLS-316]|uniref:hypothetical protein n=1 Tax=unclassified Streptomyces TaxID=2593676 RepID=UPI000823F5C7|nr:MULTISPECIES: hypothetical protein [unclassified Streptomyces]MYQ39157.1 hypothetical protein [Streptomyces sp. SID4921]SCK41383.1 hypothetical protein B046DRAFT_03927 [Streptomyces sp. LamerLS-316]